MIQGISEASQSISFAAMAERQQELGETDPAGSGGRIAVVVHRRRRHEHDAQQRAFPDQSQAARQARRRRSRDPPPAGCVAQACGHHAVPAARAGPDDRGPRQPHAIPVHARLADIERRSTPGCRSWSTISIRSPNSPTSPATCSRRACRPTSTSTATRAGRLGITPAAIDNVLYDAFGQRLVSTIFTESNQYRVVLEVKPEFQHGLEGAEPHVRAGPDATRTASRRRRRAGLGRRRPQVRRHAAGRDAGVTSADAGRRRNGQVPLDTVTHLERTQRRRC